MSEFAKVFDRGVLSGVCCLEGFVQGGFYQNASVTTES